MGDTAGMSQASLCAAALGRKMILHQINFSQFCMLMVREEQL